MSAIAPVTSPSEDRVRGDRLRKLRDRVNSIGKRNLEDVFELGTIFEDAAELLKGSFGVWVLHECKIEPRTVLGYRKVARNLAEHRNALIEYDLTPSAAITLASASAAGRAAGLAALSTKRRINAKDMKLVVSVGKPVRKRETIGIQAFRKVASERAVEVTKRLQDLVSEISSALKADRTTLIDLAKAARRLHPELAAMTTDMVATGEYDLNALASAAETFAQASKREQLEAAASRLLDAVSRFGTPTSTPDEPERAPEAVAKHQLTYERWRSLSSVSSPFHHGMTSFEICAGAGGQAAGLSQSGFRHQAMIEREADACNTLRAAFGDEHVIEADLVGYEPGDLGPIDLFAGGPPCQPYSKASSERKGKDDSRDCFPEALRLIGRLQPRAIMLENVTGLFDPDYDMYRHRILGQLSAMGYRCEWRKVFCSHFGIAQKRVRTILIGFKDPVAMARFVWPQSHYNYKVEPYTAVEAIESWLRSGGWEPPIEVLEALDCLAPTVIGGSKRKASPDFGQRNTSEVWAKMGFVKTRWGLTPPHHDHSGPIVAANGMIAALQGFPVDWPFRGTKKEVSCQIGNAFPPRVALYLGCAIATALTGEYQDPIKAIALQGTRFRLPNRRLPREGEDLQASLVPASARLPKLKELPLKRLKETSSLNLPEPSEGDVHDIDYGALFNRFGPWPQDMWAHQRKYGRFPESRIESEHASSGSIDREGTEAELTVV